MKCRFFWIIPRFRNKAGFIVSMVCTDGRRHGFSACPVWNPDEVKCLSGWWCYNSEVMPLIGHAGQIVSVCVIFYRFFFDVATRFFQFKNDMAIFSSLKSSIEPVTGGSLWSLESTLEVRTPIRFWWITEKLSANFGIGIAFVGRFRCCIFSRGVVYW